MDSELLDLSYLTAKERKYLMTIIDADKELRTGLRKRYVAREKVYYI